MKRAKKSAPAATKAAKAKPKAGARPVGGTAKHEDGKAPSRTSKAAKAAKSTSGPASAKRTTAKGTTKHASSTSGAKPASAKPASAKPSSGKPANETSLGGKPASAKPAGGKPPTAKSSAVPDARTTRKPELAVRIRELEAELDRRIDEASRRDLSTLDPEPPESSRDVAASSEPSPPDAPPPFAPLPSGPLPSDVVLHGDVGEQGGHEDAFLTPRPSGPLPAARPSRLDVAVDDDPRAIPAATESVIDTARETARELLSSDFYLRKWGRLAMRGRSEEVDDFGYDPTYDERLRPMLDFLYATYFRVETQGIDNVPKSGRAVLVANHSGTLPLDGLMIKTAIRREHEAARPVRWLTEDFIYHFPYVGSVMNRLGAVRACQENAERLLAKEQLLAVFPEGIKGIGKLFAERYRLQRFGRGGFVKLCLRTSTPIVPVAIVGAEETNPMLFRLERLSKLFGLPYVPITPTFPLLGPVGLLPAPTKWQMIFGEPIDLSGYDASAADDDLLVARLAERVRTSIQTTLDLAVTARKSVFFG